MLLIDYHLENEDCFIFYIKIMSFLSNSALYLNILYVFGLCPFTINQQTNQLQLTCRQTIIYSITVMAILLLSAFYCYVYFADFLKIPSVDPSNSLIIYVSETINLYSIGISCLIVITTSIYHRYNYIKIYMTIENLDIQLTQYYHQKYKINYHFVQTIILPFFIFFGCSLLATNTTHNNETLILIGFLIIYSIYASIVLLSLLHINHLAIELFKRLKKIQINAKKYLKNHLLINKNDYQKFVIIIELLDTFYEAKMLLNNTIGWTITINYLSDFVLLTLALFESFVLLVRYDASSRDKTKVIEIFLLFILPYVVKVLSLVQALNKIGVNQVIVFIKELQNTGLFNYIYYMINFFFFVASANDLCDVQFSL